MLFTPHQMGYAMVQLVEVLHYKPEGRSFYSCGVIGIFIDLIFWPHYGPGVNLTSNRNEYQAYFLGVKVAGDNLTTFMYRLPRNSASLNLLEP